ncbi:tetratricopeptide repeat protein [Geomesophilobacter sediminis]|uniref:Lipoprotein n=1 Tax=Geomesophilobacter sediminis TaxID=2798584 RepID=A0A8J7M2Z2_9BACT|nr:tetratricopeptide repeat protein [Geomesophilobacter sediminis]MBJ6727785.1 hypothetical protein [Geomesophilobacter sediminis]
MKRLAMLGVLVLVVATAGCSGNKSQELLETARFEEKQNNRDHARQLYQEIVAKYPDSPGAKEARERLAALGAKP